MSTLSIAAVIASMCLLLIVQQFRLRHYRKAYELQGVQQQRMARDLKLATTHTETVLDNLPWVVLIMDIGRSQMLYANPMARKRLGVTDIESLNKLWRLSPEPGADAALTPAGFIPWARSAGQDGGRCRNWSLPVCNGLDAHLQMYVNHFRFEQQPVALLSGLDVSPFMDESRDLAARIRVFNALAGDRTLAETLDLITERAEQTITGSRCCVLVLNPQKRALSCAGQAPFATDYRQHLGDTPLQYGATSAGTAAYTNTPVVCEGLQQDPSWQGWRNEVKQLGVASAWAMPFVDSTGTVCGVLNLFFDTPGQPAEEQLEALGPLLHLASLAVERENQRVQMSRVLSSERFFRDIGTQIHALSTDTYAEDLKAILRQVCEYLDLSAMALWSSSDSAPNTLRLLSETQEVASLTKDIPTDEIEALLEGADRAYLTPAQTGHYHRLCLDNLEWPLFVLAIAPDKSTLDGLLVVSLGAERLAPEIESYLELIADKLENALRRIWLMESLSEQAASDRSVKETLEGELNIAKDIQMSMIPGGGQYKRKTHGWDIRALLRPARAVGGDFFSDATLPDGRALIVIGDVSDKGVPAALFMSKVVTILNFLTKEMTDLPSLISRLNNELAVDNESCMFATLIGVTLDPRSGQVEYCNAGHCSPLLVHQDLYPVFLNKDSGPPVGLYEDVQFPSHTMTLSPESSLVLYSDGITEAMNPFGKMFGDERLAEVAHAASTRPGNIVEHIDTMVTAYAGESPQSDDLTIMVVTRKYGSDHEAMEAPRDGQ